MELPVLKIGSVLLSPIISGFVELVKYFGMNKEYARFLTGALWVLGFAGMTVLEGRPDLVPIVVNILIAAIGFLATTGFYHVVIKK